MVNIPKAWSMSIQRRKTSLKTARAHLRVIRRQGKGGEHYYVEMRWGTQPRYSKLLGLYPATSPTPLMDIVLYAAHAPGRLELDDLYHLLAADKSFQMV